MTNANVTLGSISHGTMVTEHLISAFVEELQRIVGKNATQAEDVLIGEANAYLERDSLNADEESLVVDDSEDAGDDILNALFDTLNEYAPPYAYFGAHEGDGSDYGFWLSSDALEQFDGLRVSDTSEVPDDYVGEVMHVNDHGNMTLYARDAGSDKLREIWAVV